MASNTTGTTLASLATAPATVATWLGKLQYLLANQSISNLLVKNTGAGTEITGAILGVGTLKATNTNILGKNYGTLSLELTDGTTILAMGYFSATPSAGYLKMTGSASSLYITDSFDNMYSARGVFGLNSKATTETPAAVTLSEVSLNGLSKLTGSISVASSLKTTGSITGVTVLDNSQLFANSDLLGRVSKSVKLDAALLSLSSFSDSEIAKASSALAKTLLTETTTTGSSGDDSFQVTTSGIYTFKGLAGSDTVNFSGQQANYEFYRTGSNVIVATNNALMQFITLADIDVFHFADGMISWLDLLKKTPSNYADWLEGTSGADSINALMGNDTILGGVGNDTLDGGAGDDDLRGGDGDDTYYVDSVKDLVLEAEQAGTDTVYSSVSINMPSNVERIYFTGAKAISTGNALGNTMVGTQGGDSLSGGDGDDFLQGNGGNDSLLGGAGNDTLVGGAGKDMLEGGSGNDIFVLGSGIATIKDFEVGKNLLQIAKTVYSKSHPDLASNFIADNIVLGSKASTASQYFIFDPKKGGLFYDADGTGPSKAIQLAVIVGLKNIGVSDFSFEG